MSTAEPIATLSVGKSSRCVITSCRPFRKVFRVKTTDVLTELSATSRNEKSPPEARSGRRGFGSSLARKGTWENVGEVNAVLLQLLRADVRGRRNVSPHCDFSECDVTTKGHYNRTTWRAFLAFGVERVQTRAAHSCVASTGVVLSDDVLTEIQGKSKKRKSLQGAW